MVPSSAQASAGMVETMEHAGLIVRDNVFISEGPEQRVVALSDIIPPAMMRSCLWRVEDFELLKELYRGKTSLLYMATDKRSGMQVALKLYRKRKLSLLNRYQVEREIRIHIKLDHENIIKLWAAFEDEKNVYLVQEFAGGGDLFEDMKKAGGQIKERQAVREVLYPFLSALIYLHGMGIIHRDIKPENILLSSERVIKIADFGLSIDVTQERPVTRAGTLDYMAPEVLVCPDKRRPEENKEKTLLAYNAQVDAWAVGILAFELMVGYPPFEQESRAATYEHIMYQEPKYPAWMTEDARSFISLALCKNSTQRSAVGDLVRQPWMLQHLSRNTVQQLCSGALSASPTSAPSSPTPSQKAAAAAAAAAEAAAAAAHQRLQMAASGGAASSSSSTGSFYTAAAAAAAAEHSVQGSRLSVVVPSSSSHGNIVELSSAKSSPTYGGMGPSPSLRQVHSPGYKPAGHTSPTTLSSSEHPDAGSSKNHSSSGQLYSEASPPYGSGTQQQQRSSPPELYRAQTMATGQHQQYNSDVGGTSSRPAPARAGSFTLAQNNHPDFNEMLSAAEGAGSGYGFGAALGGSGGYGGMVSSSSASFSSGSSPTSANKARPTVASSTKHRLGGLTPGPPTSPSSPMRPRLSSLSLRPSQAELAAGHADMAAVGHAGGGGGTHLEDLSGTYVKPQAGVLSDDCVPLPRSASHSAQGLMGRLTSFSRMSSNASPTAGGTAPRPPAADAPGHYSPLAGQGGGTGGGTSFYADSSYGDADFEASNNSGGGATSPSSSGKTNGLTKAFSRISVKATADTVNGGLSPRGGLTGATSCGSGDGGGGSVAGKGSKVSGSGSSFQNMGIVAPSSASFTSSGQIRRTGPVAQMMAAPPPGLASALSFTRRGSAGSTATAPSSPSAAPSRSGSNNSELAVAGRMTSESLMMRPPMHGMTRPPGIGATSPASQKKAPGVALTKVDEFLNAPGVPPASNWA